MTTLEESLKIVSSLISTHSNTILTSSGTAAVSLVQDEVQQLDSSLTISWVSPNLIQYDGNYHIGVFLTKKELNYPILILTSLPQSDQKSSEESVKREASSDSSKLEPSAQKELNQPSLLPAEDTEAKIFLMELMSTKPNTCHP